jgi:hypothetical protein
MSFIKLAVPTKLVNHAGLKMDDGFHYVHGKNYMYVDIPSLSASEIKKASHVFLEAAATVDVKGQYLVMIEANPVLAEYGQVQSGYYIHPGSGQKRLGVWFFALKPLSLSELEYLVRLYMVD